MWHVSIIMLLLQLQIWVIGFWEIIKWIITCKDTKRESQPLLNLNLVKRSRCFDEQNAGVVVMTDALVYHYVQPFRE